MVILGAANAQLQLIGQVIVQACAKDIVFLGIAFHVIAHADKHRVQVGVHRRNHIVETDIPGEIIHRVIHVTGQRRGFDDQPLVVTVANDDFHGLAVTGRIVTQGEQQRGTVTRQLFGHLLHVRASSEHLEAGTTVIVDAIQPGQGALGTAQIVEVILRVGEIIPPHDAAAVLFQFRIQLAAAAGIVATHRRIAGDRVVICGIQITAHFVFGVQILVGVVGQGQVGIAADLTFHEHGSPAVHAIVKFIGHIRGCIAVVTQATGAALHL